MLNSGNSCDRRSARCRAARYGVSVGRIIILLILVAAIGAIAFDLTQRYRRNNAEAALVALDNNPKRDPNDEKKVILPADPNKPPATRLEIHADVFGGGEPAAKTPEGSVMYKESWTFPGVFTNYVIDVEYALDVTRMADNNGTEESNYYMVKSESRNISHFDSKPLIEDNPMYNFKPSGRPAEPSMAGFGGGGGTGRQGRGNQDSDDKGADDKGSDDKATGDVGSGDSGSGDDASKNGGADDQGKEPPVTAPPTGDGKGDGGTGGDGGSGDGQ